jgi:hypothetical protein
MLACRRLGLLVKAPVQLRAVPKLAVPKLAVPKLAVSKLAVRAGGITVLSTFSAMAVRSYCMDVLEEEVDMDFLDGNESAASAAEESAASAAEESAASAAEDSAASNLERKDKDKCLKSRTKYRLYPRSFKNTHGRRREL